MASSMYNDIVIYDDGRHSTWRVASSSTCPICPIQAILKKNSVSGVAAGWF